MIKKIEEIVSSVLSESAHDLEHTYRVYNNCVKIAKTVPNVNLEVLKVAALMHDIARVEEDNNKDKNLDHAILGAERANEILSSLGCNENFKHYVCSAIRTHRFRGERIPETIEAKILYDADKIDAIGYIGICRSYMIAGQFGQKIYNDTDIEKYLKSNIENNRIKNLSLHSPNIEFLTKNVKIPNKLFTEEGKRIANKRIQTMKLFFEELKNEIDSND